MTESADIAQFPQGQAQPRQVVFQRSELTRILDLYGRMVAAGAWRDYAIDSGKDEAVFAVFRRASEGPLYRIVKRPSLAARQGAYMLVNADGRVLKRGHRLANVLSVLENQLVKLSE